SHDATAMRSDQEQLALRRELALDHALGRVARRIVREYEVPQRDDLCAIGVSILADDRFVHAGHAAAAISAAPRSPERTAPSIAPCEIVAVSVPAQCTRPNGWRSRCPWRVRVPSVKWAIEHPRVHGSVHHDVSTYSAGFAARAPKRAASASSTTLRRTPASSC